MERLFGLDIQLLQDVLITGVNIFILFLVLSYVCIDMVRDFIKKRQDKIKGELDFAATEKKDAIALKEEYDAKLRQINAEADEILDAARKKALKKEAEIIEEAKQEARRQGYSFVQVKTVQMGRYSIYDDTNRFYLSLGFKELEVFPTLWDECNPCQIYIMAI